MNTLEKYWYDGKIKYPEIQDDGFEKDVTKEFMIPAVTFGESEEKLVRETMAITGGNYEVTSMTKTKVEDVRYHSALAEDSKEKLKWYKVKVNNVWDDENGKERKDAHLHMIQATSTDEVNTIIHEMNKDAVNDYQIADIVETKVVECFTDE